MNVSSPNNLMNLTRNTKDRVYKGSNFFECERPERYKRYSGSKIPLNTLIEENSLFSSNPVMQVLRKILSPAFGVTSVKYYKHQPELLRSVPSAGGCYPIDIYLLIRSVKGFPPGVYYYSPIENGLYFVSEQNDFTTLDLTLIELDKELDIHFIFTISPWRSCWKYSYRGYKYSLIDAGHVMFNVKVILDSLKIDHHIYTQVNPQPVRTFLDINDEEVPIGIISFNISEEQDQSIEVAPPLNSGSCLVDSKHIPHLFDWGPIYAFEQLSIPNSKPSKDWLCSSKTSPTFDYDTLLKLLTTRRSSSSFERTYISKDSLEFVLSGMYKSELPFNIYCVVHSVQNMIPGIYKYEDGFKLLKGDELRESSWEICFNQEIVKNSSIVLYFSSKFEGINDKENAALFKKYLIEAGFIGQLCYILANHQGLGVSSIGGFYDDKIEEFLELQPNEEVLLSTVLGLPEKSEKKIKEDLFRLNIPEN
ncbi:SagB/ThcOx family dehydrogenase [Cytobacillus pseudoceanisediminis]|uniref:SagB/ThcOx family dehydrogenase n=1 Tax=Cytobacillus pseudoceanisediminis TaxID=3051614 RepID=UPI003C2BC981